MLEAVGCGVIGPLELAVGQEAAAELRVRSAGKRILELVR